MIRRRQVTAFEMTRRLAAARLRRRGPLYLVHALTARCNARCGFCAWNPDFYDPRDQLSTEAIEELYTDARDAGFIGVSIWGGEPLLHPDFERIVAHAKAVGLTTNMVTNGFLLERKMDAVLAHIDRVCISVDHPSATHDEIRGIRGLFDRIVSATREIRRRDPHKPIVFITTFQKANIEPAAIREMAQLLKELDVVGVFNAMREEPAADTSSVEENGTKRGRVLAQTDSISAFVPSAEELSLAFKTVDELKRHGFPILNSHTHIAMMRNAPPVYRCHWPKLMLPIEANGDVVDCMHWGTRPLGNLRETKLPQILESERLRELAIEGESCHKCVSIHRIEISEVWEGNLEPIKSWRLLRKQRPLGAMLGRLSHR